LGIAILVLLVGGRRYFESQVRPYVSMILLRCIQTNVTVYFSIGSSVVNSPLAEVVSSLSHSLLWP